MTTALPAYIRNILNGTKAPTPVGIVIAPGDNQGIRFAISVDGDARDYWAELRRNGRERVWSLVSADPEEFSSPRFDIRDGEVIPLEGSMDTAGSKAALLALIAYHEDNLKALNGSQLKMIARRLSTVRRKGEIFSENPVCETIIDDLVEDGALKIQPWGEVTVVNRYLLKLDGVLDWNE
jgi:hypothetical protein